MVVKCPGVPDGEFLSMPNPETHSINDYVKTNTTEHQGQEAGFEVRC